MKRSSLFLLGGMAASLMACSGRIEPTSARVVDPVRHYYPMVAGDRLTIAYEIENTGSNPLVISEIQTSCMVGSSIRFGCTVTSSPRA